jgi:hypothetical protein
MFKDDDAQIVTAAVQALIAADEKGFPPVIGQVKAYMRMLMPSDELSEMEAWTLVSRAASRGVYHAKDEFEKLPPLIQETLGSPQTLIDWGMIEERDFQTVTQSNFMRTYRAKAEKAREYRALPDNVKALIGGAVKQLEG